MRSRDSPELCRPETLSYEPLLRQAIARGALVHAVSDFVAAEVRDYFNLPEHRVVRVYAGIAATADGDAVAGRELAGGASYVLAIGTVEPRKNLPTLVRAFDRVAADDDGVMLVVAGPDGWGTQPFADAVAHARFGVRIRRLGYVTNAQRSDLLAGAAVLAYPSLYEGFGHPPFEAMAAGVPVVTARAGALPEAVGDAAVLVDPTDVDALADALSRVLTDPALRARSSSPADTFGCGNSRGRARSTRSSPSTDRLPRSRECGAKGANRGIPVSPERPRVRSEGRESGYPRFA